MATSADELIIKTTLEGEITGWTASAEAQILQCLKKSNRGNPIVVARDGAEALKYLFATDAYADRDDTDLPADERTKLSPIIILTSSGEQRDIVAGFDLGANSFVRKPVEFNEFTAAVQNLGMYWLLLNQPILPR